MPDFLFLMLLANPLVLVVLIAWTIVILALVTRALIVVPRELAAIRQELAALTFFGASRAASPIAPAPEARHAGELYTRTGPLGRL